MKITNLLDTSAAHIASAAPSAVRFFGVVVLLSSLSSLAYAQDRGPLDFQGHKKQTQGGNAAGVGTDVSPDSGSEGEGADSGDDNSDDVNDPVDGPPGNNPNTPGNANGANSGHHCVPPHNVGCKPAVPQ